MMPPPPPGGVGGALPPPPLPPPGGALPPPPPPTTVGVPPVVPLAVPPPSIPRPSLSKTVLLTNLPELFHEKSRLRTWLVEVVGVRHIHMCSPQALQRRDNHHPEKPSTTASSLKPKTRDLFSLLKLDIGAEETVSSVTVKKEDESQDKNKRETVGSVPVLATHALVTCAHADGAMKLVSAMRQFWTQRNSNQNTNDSVGRTAVHWVPVQPNLPLPPPTSFPDYTPELVDSLCEKLQVSYEHLLSSSSGDPSQLGGPNASNNPADTTTTTAANSSGITMGEDGGDGEEEDPLQNPAVLSAVRQFRQSLEQQQGHKAVRRKELVMNKLEAAMERLRQQPPPGPPGGEGPLQGQPPPFAGGPPPPPMMGPPPSMPPPPPVGGGGGELPPPPHGGTLPPPPHGGAPPMPPPPMHDLPPPPTSAAAGGGMLPPPPPNMAAPPSLPFPPPPNTEQLPQPPLPPPQGAPPQQGTGPRGVSNLPAWMTQASTTTAAAASEAGAVQPPPAKRSKVEQVGDLKEWIAKEIQQLLGEPEASLVDFIYNHATKHADRPMADLRPELQDVLEEDAPAFLDKLQEQVNQLNR